MTCRLVTTMSSTTEVRDLDRQLQIIDVLRTAGAQMTQGEVAEATGLGALTTMRDLGELWSLRLVRPVTDHVGRVVAWVLHG